MMMMMMMMIPMNLAWGRLKIGGHSMIKHVVMQMQENSHAHKINLFWPWENLQYAQKERRQHCHHRSQCLGLIQEKKKTHAVLRTTAKAQCRDTSIFLWNSHLKQTNTHYCYNDNSHHWQGSQDSLLLELLDSWSKGCQFKSWHEQRENFPLQS